jgi:ABC-type transporter Mla maintaining outer membrane lipid asymmetry ATPase subunit MlaF
MSAPHLLECNHMIANLTEVEYCGEPMSMSADVGEIVSLIGPDYAGKTDWLKTMAGIFYPVAGDIRFSGKSFFELDDNAWTRMRQRNAYIRGDAALLSVASGLANVMLPARYHGIGDDETIKSKALNLIIELGANQSLDELPAFVRRDQRFKLAVARALMLDPDILFLDNPFAFLDSQATTRFKNFLMRRVRQQGLALVMLANDLEFTLRVADKVLFISAEKVYCFDSIAALKACSDAAVAEFIGKSPVGAC